jgi:hypothetical protein
LKEDHGHAEKNPFERKTLHHFAPFCTSLMWYYYTGGNGKGLTYIIKDYKIISEL